MEDNGDLLVLDYISQEKRYSPCRPQITSRKKGAIVCKPWLNIQEVSTDLFRLKVGTPEKRPFSVL